MLVGCGPSYVLCSLLPKEGFSGSKPRAGNTGRWEYYLNKGRVKNVRAPRAKGKQARPQEAVFGPDREEGKEAAFRVCEKRRR